MREERTGILYRQGDYPGAVRRILIDAVDFLVIGITGLCAFFASAFFVDPERIFAPFFLVWLVLGFAYIGPWKATGIPTLGYFLFGVKLVNARGGRIDFWQASGRGLFLFIGPLNYLIDLFWLYGETPRQALRDKFNGTYLVRKDAQAEAMGRLVPRTLHVMGYRVRVEQIERNG